MLWRLSSPSQWANLEPLYGIRSSAMSELFQDILKAVYDAWADLVTKLHVDLIAERGMLYADEIHKEGSTLKNCLGFIHCIKIAMERPSGPSVLQRNEYFGHKRIQCLVYQTIKSPYGIIFHIYGPKVGRWQEITLYSNFGMDQLLDANQLIEETRYLIYGDAAYMLQPWLLTECTRFNAKKQSICSKRRWAALDRR